MVLNILLASLLRVKSGNLGAQHWLTVMESMLGVRGTGEIVDQDVLYLLAKKVPMAIHVKIPMENVIMIVNAKMVLFVVLIIVLQPGIFPSLQIVAQHQHLRNQKVFK